MADGRVLIMSVGVWQSLHSVKCGGEENHVCVRVCLCVLRARVKISRGELITPPTPRLHRPPGLMLCLVGLSRRSC